MSLTKTTAVGLINPKPHRRAVHMPNGRNDGRRYSLHRYRNRHVHAKMMIVDIKKVEQRYLKISMDGGTIGMLTTRKHIGNDSVT